MDDFEEKVRRLLALLEEKTERLVRKKPWQSWMDNYLHDLDRHRGVVCRAAELCPVTRSTIYRHKKKNPDFSERWDAIVERAEQRRRGRV